MPIVQLQAMAGNAAVTALLWPIVVQRVQLTYDDGPDEGGQTQKAVDELQDSGARATFYLVGKRVQKGDNWKTVFNIAASGNWLGNHAFDWNEATDNHIFLSGTKEERAEKILMTELAIRDALIKGKNDAIATGRWEKIAPLNRHYVEDVIANGTGRFRTPGFKTHYIAHPLSGEGKTQDAIDELDNILGASGLRRFEQSDSVDIDMKDWEKVDKGKPSARPKTQAEIEKAYIDELNSKNDPKASILLHSRLPASVAASPAIIDAIKKKGWDFSAEPRGGFDDIVMKAPKHEELVKARNDFLPNPGSTAAEAADAAVVILQKAQASRNPDEVNDFIAELESTPVTGAAPAATSTAGTATPTRAPGAAPLTLKEWMYGQKKFQMLFDFFKARNASLPAPVTPAPVPTPSPTKAATPSPTKALAPAMTAPYPPGGEMSKRYWALSPAQRADVNAAADKMFAEHSGMSRPRNWDAASDRPAARAWLRIRDEVMATREAEPAGVQK